MLPNTRGTRRRKKQSDIVGYLFNNRSYVDAILINHSFFILFFQYKPRSKQNPFKMSLRSSHANIPMLVILNNELLSHCSHVTNSRLFVFILTPYFQNVHRHSKPFILYCFLLLRPRNFNSYFLRSFSRTYFFFDRFKTNAKEET